MNELTVIQPQELVRQSTDIAGLCRDIVVTSAMEIQGRKYVKVEGWQSIATAHGCVASSKDVERVDGGYRAIGEVRRMADGGLIAQAEGFVGEDEPTWFGGDVRGKMLPKRPDYAIRAMAQTRAISRACRSAFAHVVVLMDAGLSTTPAEEVPHGGFDDRHSNEAVETRQRTREEAARSVVTEQPQQREPKLAMLFNGDWREVEIPFGKKKGTKLGALNERDLKWWQDNYEPKPYEKTGFISDKDLMFRAVLDASMGKVPVGGKDETPDDDEIPGLFNGEKHKRLAADLAFHNISEPEFMAAMKDAGHIPAEAKAFRTMTEETAAKFQSDLENVIALVEAYRAKQ